MKNLLRALWLMVLLQGCATRMTTSSISLVTDPSAGEPAKHGAEKLMAALSGRHIAFEQVHSLQKAQGNTVIVAGLASDHALFADESLKAFRESIPTNAEALAIRKISTGGKTILAIGGADATGLMYAEQDVADRISWSKDANTPLSEVRNTVETPVMTGRGVTLFAMNRAYWESRFYDEKYWTRYLDTLAENRFNSMIVVLGYEDGGFLAPSYPYFFDTPGFADIKMIGITAAQQKQNTEALNRLIAMCHARGIRFTIGLWDHIYRGGVQNGGSVLGNTGLQGPTPSLVWGMNATNLIPYTQASLKMFFTQFPGIDGVQFRIHDESGLRPSEFGPFWKAVFATVMETVPKMPIDLRAKGLRQEEIQSAFDAGLNFHISTKFWEEQMGLPFHPTHVNPRDQSNARHSFAGLLVYPQKYQMDWQLWNGGTSRVFLFGDPDYARRFIGSAHLYNGNTFEIDEPLATKMEGQAHDAKPFDLMKPSARYYDYEFERYWHLLQSFGRIGYDTNTPAEVWDHEFAKRFGTSAGPVLEDALHHASWILPRIVASSYPYTGFPMTAGWAEKQSLGDLPLFARADFSDVQLFENFDEEAQLLIDRGETPKVRPQETSLWFAQTADYLESHIADAEKRISSQRSKEFDSTVLDLKMLANLARYHSHRILAAISYRLYDRTRDPARLDDAINYERQAIAAWRKMVDTAGDTYASDLTFGARSRDLCGHWRDELASLENAFTKLEEERKNIPANASFTASPRCVSFTKETMRPKISHEPVRTVPVGTPIIVRVKVSAPSGIKWVHLRYRPIDQTKNYETLDMQLDSAGNYEATIPADKINSRYDLMYFIEAMDNEHHGAMFPDFNKETPYYFVHLDRKSGRG
jgi:hypothetical protein